MQKAIFLQCKMNGARKHFNYLYQTLETYKQTQLIVINLTVLKHLSKKLKNCFEKVFLKL